MTAGNSTALAMTTPSDTEVVATRVFNAPRELVFKAYTDPTLVPRWWSPPRHNTVVDKMDVRVGGAWRYVVQDRATDVEIVAFSGEFREIAAPERIVRTENFEPVGPYCPCTLVSGNRFTITLQSGKGQAAQRQKGRPCAGQPRERSQAGNPFARKGRAIAAEP